MGLARARAFGHDGHKALRGRRGRRWPGRPPPRSWSHDRRAARPVHLDAQVALRPGEFDHRAEQPGPGPARRSGPAASEMLSDAACSRWRALCRCGPACDQTPEPSIGIGRSPEATAVGCRHIGVICRLTVSNVWLPSLFGHSDCFGALSGQGQTPPTPNGVAYDANRQLGRTHEQAATLDDTAFPVSPSTVSTVVLERCPPLDRDDP
jgi:hypothetical protein